MTEKEAQILGDKLTNRLKEKLGGNWKIRIWENFGWHYSSILLGGSIAVYKRKKYSTMISLEIDVHGPSWTSWCKDECWFEI